MNNSSTTCPKINFHDKSSVLKCFVALLPSYTKCTGPVYLGGNFRHSGGKNRTSSRKSETRILSR